MYFNYTDILRLFLRWKWVLLLTTGSAILLSVFFSSPIFIKPKFKTETVLYPSNLIPFSNESSSEQLIQLFMSNEIRDSIIKKYNLFEHYEIDTNNLHYKTYMEKELDGNIFLSKTEFEAVKLEVYDTEPKLSYALTLDLIRLLNKKIRELHRSKSEEVVLIHKSELDKKQSEIDSINIALKELKVKFGLIDYKAQTKEASRAYYRSLEKNTSKTPDIVSSIRNLEEKGGDFIALEEKLEGALKAFNKIKINYDAAVRDVEKNLTYTNVVVKPRLPDKKAYPVRWVIVLVSSISTLVMTIIFVLLVEQRKGSLNQ